MFGVVRILSLILILLALILLGADAVTSLERHGHIVVRSLDVILAFLDRPVLDAFKGWVLHTLPAPAPHWVFSTLALPGWSVPGVIGVILAFLFGKRSGPL
jgi:hypothetical protein